MVVGGRLMPDRVAAIIAQTAADHGLPVSAILCKSRLRAFALARRQAMWKVRQLRIGGQPHAFALIGRWFGRDHSTVVVACKRVEREMAEALLEEAA